MNKNSFKISLILYNQKLIHNNIRDIKRRRIFLKFNYYNILDNKVLPTNTAFTSAIKSN